MEIYEKYNGKRNIIISNYFLFLGIPNKIYFLEWNGVIVYKSLYFFLY